LKPLLVGEDNPLRSDPVFALYPLPAGRSGDRLRKILGLTCGEYVRKFSRVNLCGGAWAWKEARAEASKIMTDRVLSGAPVILLGAKVAAAFGLPSTPFKKYGSVLVLPHPSGRCRVWNKRGSAARARRAVSNLIEEPRRGA